jgi:NADH:ubiquinone oxidoreductase subunit 2 (subunit N)
MISALMGGAALTAPGLAIGALAAGAVLAFAMPHPRSAWIFSIVATVTSLAAMVWIVARAFVMGDLTIVVAQPRAALLVEGSSLIGAALCAATVFLMVMAAGKSLWELEARSRAFALSLLQLCALGWLLALFAPDFASLIIGAATAWLASVGLVALSGDRQSGALSGAMQMLTYGAFGVAFALAGAAFIYRGVGSLELSALLETRADAVTSALGFGLVLIGFLIKVGAAPLHAWIGGVFGRANGAASLSLGVLGVVGASAAIMRIVSYGTVAPEIGSGLGPALNALGFASVAIGSVQAMGARSLQRLAAYAIVAQIGGILLCLALGSPAGFAAALVQLVALCGGALALHGGAVAAGARRLSDCDGLVRRAPIASIAMTLGVVSVIGAPLTLGFLGRWRLIEAGVGADWWWPVGAMVFGSLAAVIYGGRLLERLYFRRAQTPFEGTRSVWDAVGIAPLLITAVAIIALGLAPQALLDAADAASLLGGAP